MMQLPSDSAVRPPQAELDRTQVQTRDGSTRRLAVVAVLCAVAAGIWVVATVLTVAHGFDISDEGFYLLSYRWWDVNYRTFTGAQYVYGPVFELLGYNIAALRLFRLATVIGTHVLFGWMFMRWLRLRRPHAPDTRLWEVAGTAAIVAAGGMVFCWLPLSPGYNDISLLGALLAATVVLRFAVDVHQGIRTPAWVAVSLGVVAFAVVLSRWSSSVVTLGVVGIVGVAIVAPSGVREVARLVAWTVTGVAGVAVLVQLFVIPLTDVVGPMYWTNRLVSISATHSISDLLEMYVWSAANVLETVITVHWLLLVVAVFAVVARGRVLQVAAFGLMLVGIGISAWRIISRGDFHGGAINFEHFPVSLLLVVSVALLVGLCVVLDRRRSESGMSSLSREGLRGFAVLAMVASMPVTQAAGTGNQIHFMAINGFAAWVAIMIAVLTGIESSTQIARWLTGAAVGGAVLLSAIIPTDAQWTHPYRTANRAITTSVAHDVPALSSLYLDPDVAEQYSRLHRLLEPYIHPAGRAMMGFDGLAGVVFALEGRPVGEAWYGGRDPTRSSSGIRSQCRNEPWWGDRAPILIFNRPVRQSEIDVLQFCGLDFDTDYRLLAPTEDIKDLIIYVPAGENIVPSGGE
jgi:hypothetical protein